MPKRLHPFWFDPSTSCFNDQWKFALALGRGVGLASPDDWSGVETALRDLWEEVAPDQAWADARAAIYAGWLEAQGETHLRDGEYSREARH